MHLKFIILIEIWWHQYLHIHWKYQFNIASRRNCKFRSKFNNIIHNPWLTIIKWICLTQWNILQLCSLNSDPSNGINWFIHHLSVCLINSQWKWWCQSCILWISHWYHNSIILLILYISHNTFNFNNISLIYLWTK